MSQIKKRNDEECVFCTLFDKQEADVDRYILYKDADIAIVLNLYPYNGGHLLIIPKLHVENLYDLSEHVLTKIMKSSALSCQFLKQALACEAVNFGANIGRVAGAGIPEHIHMHIVPRFGGDTGFFTTIGNAKQISVDLHDIYQKLKPYFETLTV